MTSTASSSPAGTYRFKVTALAGKAKQTVKGSVKVIAAKK